MANIVTSSVVSLQFTDAGGANAETVEGSLCSPVTIEDNSDTVQRGNKVDKAVGRRHTISGTVFVNGDGTNGFGHLGTGQDLYALMLAGTEIGLIVTFEGDSSYDVWTYDPGLCVITPRMAVLDQDKSSLLVHDDGSVDAPTGYTDLGDILGGTNPEFNAITVPDGQGRPIYVRTTMTWQPQLIDMSQAGAIVTADADSDDMVRLAIARGTSTETYIHLDDVNLVKETRGTTEEFAVVVPDLFASWRDYRPAKVEWPASPPNFLFGFDFQMVCSGSAESDFLTIG